MHTGNEHPENKKETTQDVKEQAQEGDLKKGYNEKNPGQEEGAFTPDSKDENTPDEAPGAASLGV